MIEKIIEEHQETRTKRRHNNDASQQMKDLLDILLDISEDESSDIRLTRENIKAFILVKLMAASSCLLLPFIVAVDL